MTLAALWEVARSAALRGAEELLRAAGDPTARRASSKSRNDYVTEADRASERAIAATILAAFPDHRILGEEFSPDLPLAEGPTWIVDPLDGTTNFIHGFPIYSVSVACAVDGRIVAGAVHDPTRAETFHAARGQGAYLGHQRLRVTTPGSLDGTLIATGFPFRELAHLELFLATFREVMKRTAGVRRAGSAAIDMAYVAAGRFDGFWEEGLGPWDMAAGTLLIQEAGGIVTDYAGHSSFLQRGQVVAGSAAVQRALLELVNAPRHPATI